MTQRWILVFDRLQSCESISRRRRFHSDKKNRHRCTLVNIREEVG